MSGLDSFPKSIGSGVVLELRDSAEQSLVPTNAFSTSYLERRLEIDKNPLAHNGTTSEKTDQVPSDYIEAQIGSSGHEDVQIRQNCPISSLQSAEVNCRVLVQPSEIDGFEIPDARWVTLLPRHVQAGSDDSILGVKCLAVHETPEHTSFSIQKPLPCNIFLGPYDDSVGVANRSRLPLHIRHSASVGSSEADLNDRINIAIPAHSTSTLAPGAWEFSQADSPCAFQVLVFPRRHILEVVALSMRVVAGHKRDATGQGAPAQPTVENSPVTRRLGCLSEMTHGEQARLYAPDANDEEIEKSDYSLFRMRRLGETKSAVVFQARHSAYAERIIVVKALKRRSGRDLVSRGLSWEKEMEVHLNIHSVSYNTALLVSMPLTISRTTSSSF